MIFCNLQTRPSKLRSQTKPMILALLGMVFCISIVALLGNERDESRSLYPEERQVVLFIMRRISVGNDMVSLIARGELGTYSSETESSRLVFLREGQLVFASKFFESDSATQENALREIVPSSLQLSFDFENQLSFSE